MPATPEHAEGAPPAPRASRLPRFKLPFVELPERSPPSPGLHYPIMCWKFKPILVTTGSPGWVSGTLPPDDPRPYVKLALMRSVTAMSCSSPAISPPVN